MSADNITSLKSLIDKASACFAKDLPRLLDEVGELLPVYAGLPARLDLFGILGIATDEDRHTECLRWLLDPEESHGFGDALLRRFLLRTDHDLAIEHALRAAPIGAEVRTQLEVSRYGIPDLVVILREEPGCIVVVEAKINAPLTNKDGVPQTQRYRKAAIDGALQTACVMPGLDPSAVSFVFLPMHQGQSPEDELVEDDDAARRFETVLQRTLVADCLEILRDTDTDPTVATLVRAFCTSVLRGSNDGAAYDALLGLRRVVAEAVAVRGGRRTSNLTLTRRLTANVQELRGTMGNEVSNADIRKLIFEHYEIASLLADEFKSARNEILDRIRDKAEASEEAQHLNQTLKERNRTRENYSEQESGRRLGVNGLAGVSFFLDPSSSGGLTVRVQLRPVGNALGGKAQRTGILGSVDLEDFPSAPLLVGEPSVIRKDAASLDEAQQLAVSLVVAGLRVLDRLAVKVFPLPPSKVEQGAPAVGGGDGASRSNGG